MKLDQIEAFFVRLPLNKPFTTAAGAIEHCDTVLVRLESGGVSGWGEATPGNGPYTTGEWSHGTFLALTETLLPILEAAGGIESGEKLAEIFQSVKGNRHAKGAVDMAWWDLKAKIDGKPLWESLGGKKRPIPLGLTFDRYPMTERERFFADLERAKNDHFRRISLKLRPGWEVEAVRAARDSCPSPIQLQIDAEGALDPDRHSDMLYRLQDFLPTLFEQPFDPMEYVGHAMLAESLRTPICLDESIGSPIQADIAADLGSCRVFCLKPGQVGGLTAGKAIHDSAQSERIACYAGMELTGSIGYRHLLALASLEGFTYPADYIRFEEVFADEPGEPILPVLSVFPKKEGDEAAKSETYLAAELWNEPGIGFEPKSEMIEKYAITHFSIKNR